MMYCMECGMRLREPDNICINMACKNYLVNNNKPKKTTVYCLNCGKRLPANIEVCPQCNNKMEASEKVESVLYPQNCFKPMHNTVVDAKKMYEEVKNSPLIFDFGSVGYNPNEEIINYCTNLFASNEIMFSLSDLSINQCENNIYNKRQRYSIPIDYNRRMEQNIMFEYFQYSYLLNSLDLLQGKSAEQFNINTTEFFELVFNDCKQRVMNLDNERGRSFGLAKVLDTYSSNTNRYKMPILGTVNQRENDYIVAVLMNCCMNSIIDKIFKSGIQRAIYLANTYSSRELKMTLDSVVTSQCTIRLSIYSGDVFGIR